MGFTLTELIVSIGVLALMMTMAGMVFHMTMKSTGEAKAVVSIAQRVRVLEDTLRADLAGVDPERSVLLIIPAKINAYWTAANRNADDNSDPSDGYPHPEDLEREVHVGTPPNEQHVLAAPRADRLMFVTARQGSSLIDPRISGGLQVMTYGHAILGEWERNSGSSGWKWRRQYGEPTDEGRRMRFAHATLLPSGAPPTGVGHVFPTPAQDGYLARRSALLVEYDGTNPPEYLDASKPDKYSPAVAPNLDDCRPSDPLSRPYDCKVSGTIPGTAEEPFRFALVEGRQDVVAYPHQDDGSGRFHYVTEMLTNLVHTPDTSTYPEQFRIEERPAWYARSELDLTPPAPIAERLGHALLPHCASFKVEFALDLPELHGLGEPLWIDPADLVVGAAGMEDWNKPDLPPEQWSRTRSRLEEMKIRIRPPDDDTPGVLGPYIPPDPDDPNDHGNLAAQAYDKLDRELMTRKLNPGDPDADAGIRFVPDAATGEPLARWYTRDPWSEQESTAPDALFPVALRVTIDVYDDEGRLERPMRHVMVFKLGSR